MTSHTATENDELAEHAATAPGKILVVDDTENNRALLARHLEKQKHEVLLAENGQAAFELLEKHSVDLILLDIMMPVMNGFEVLSQLNADTEWKHIPVIVISAADEKDNVIKAIELGAEDYLSKPFDKVLLRARIEACLQKKRLRDREITFRRQLAAQKKRGDTLLLQLYPYPVVQELKATGKFQPRRYSNVAVMFCDIVGFTAYCDRHEPEEVVGYLQHLIEAFEDIARLHRVEKIKTIGDSFMATAGLLLPVENPVLSCIQCGLKMIEAVRERPPGWDVRVGIHVGPVLAGVVGRQQNLFDIWGDSVNTAARVESNGEIGEVTVSAEAWLQVADRCRGRARTVDAKGKGPLEVVQFRGFVDSP